MNKRLELGLDDEFEWHKGKIDEVGLVESVV
jgi:hypothetical protein